MKKERVFFIGTPDVWANRDESAATDRAPDKEIIKWDLCDRCSDLTLHSFRGGAGKCLKCGKAV